MSLTARPFARVDDQWSRAGLRTIVLENDRVRVDILPQLGARIQRFEHRASGTDLLWHNPRIEPRLVPIGSSYDDNFAGGWDELFPNDLPETVGEDVYPDHGELWSQEWSYRIESSSPEAVTVVLSRTGSVTTTVIEKRITLVAGESQLRFTHRISNVGSRELSFLWKLHPALSIDEGDRIHVPGKRGALVDPTFGRATGPTTFPWPIAATPNGSPLDLSVVPALNGSRDFVYVDQLSEGWCALERKTLGLGFGLVFPLEVFSSVWLFMSFGGWRGHQTIVLEPCTTVPKNLNEAIRLGTARRLAPGETLECEVRTILFEGAPPHQGFDRHGTPIRQPLATLTQDSERGPAIDRKS